MGENERQLRAQREDTEKLRHWQKHQGECKNVHGDFHTCPIHLACCNGIFFFLFDHLNGLNFLDYKYTHTHTHTHTHIQTGYL